MPSNQHSLILPCLYSIAHPMQQLIFIKIFHLAFLCTVYIAWAKLLSPCCKEKKGDHLGLHQATKRVRVLSACFLPSDSFSCAPSSAVQHLLHFHIPAASREHYTQHLSMRSVYLQVNPWRHYAAVPRAAAVQEMEEQLGMGAAHKQREPSSRTMCLDGGAYHLLFI